VTIQALQSLYGGFHDALLHSYSVDLVAKSARLTLDLCLGDPDSADPTARERGRMADVVLTGLEYFIVDMPDPKDSRTPPMMTDLRSRFRGCLPLADST
jgi:hypothetical protein